VTLTDLPVLGAVLEAGPDETGFDVLLLLGPPVILLVVVLGRVPVTTGVAATYLAALVCYVLFNAVR
jgi:hypothetical protein